MAQTSACRNNREWFFFAAVAAAERKRFAMTASATVLSAEVRTCDAEDGCEGREPDYVGLPSVPQGVFWRFLLVALPEDFRLATAAQCP
jgi:hypothetical protein